MSHSRDSEVHSVMEHIVSPKRMTQQSMVCHWLHSHAGGSSEQTIPSRLPLVCSTVASSLSSHKQRLLLPGDLKLFSQVLTLLIQSTVFGIQQGSFAELAVSARLFKPLPALHRLEPGIPFHSLTILSTASQHLRSVFEQPARPSNTALHTSTCAKAAPHRDYVSQLCVGI